MAIPDIYILVEGTDDEKFMENIVVPFFKKRGMYVKVVKYRQKKYERLRNFIKFIYNQKKQCIFIADINNAPCITSRVQKIIDELRLPLERKDITIVIKEIEGWYLAGLTPDVKRKLGLRNIKIDCNKITKETLKQIRPKKFDSNIIFLLQVLENYSISYAIKENESFAYFCKKYNIDPHNPVSL